MSIESLCQVCQARTASYRCGRCGATVCAEHYASERGLCAGCSAEA